MGHNYNEVTPLSIGTNAKGKKSTKYVEKETSATIESTSSASLDPSNTSQDWPESLQVFVNNCFLRSKSLREDEKVALNTQLQVLLEKAVKNRKIWINDWTQQSIPVFDKSLKEVELECMTPMTRKDSASSSIFLPSKRVKRKVAKGKTDILKNDTVSSLPPRPSKTISEKRFDSQERKENRLARFGLNIDDQRGNIQGHPQGSTNGTFTGYCQDIEKQYLRLTSEPDPSRVRPLPVLQKSVPFVLNKFRKGKGCDYSYFNNQFKSIRQDLTVQHIKNDFTIYVYEIHAKVAIENNDLGEYNQCQSQLMYLYDLKRAHSKTLDVSFIEREAEFTCYRAMYLLLTNNSSALYKLKLELIRSSKKETKFSKHIEEIFKLQEYELLNDYYSYFSIYESFKNDKDLSILHHLMKTSMIQRQRIKSLNIIASSYRKVPIPFLIDQLKYAGEDDMNGESAFREFIEKHGLAEFFTNNEFNCSAARNKLHGIVINTGFKKIDIKGQV